VTILFDADPAQAEDTRKRILAQAVRENLLIAGMHLGRGGLRTLSEMILATLLRGPTS
jgi:hypothetical protein